jgi:hypothetical protein
VSAKRQLEISFRSVNLDFIVKGIKAGKLEYQEGAIWGNPYFHILSSPLEKHIWLKSRLNLNCGK